MLQDVFLKAIFKKMIYVDLDKVPQKSLAAAMLVEIEALSKMQVFEGTEKVTKISFT